MNTANYPESSRQRILAATWRLTLELFKDPEVQADYEAWLERRKHAESLQR